MILVDALSCGHFIVLVSFSYFSWTCCHVDNFIIFCYFNISREHVVMRTFFRFLSIEYFSWTHSHVDISLFSVIIIFFMDMLSCGHFTVFFLFNIRLGDSMWAFFCFSVILIVIVDTSLLFMLLISYGDVRNSAINLCASLEERLKIYILIFY